MRKVIMHEEDTVPVRVQDGVIDIVKDFTYLGSSLSHNREVINQMCCRIAKASQAFRHLTEPIFQIHLSISTKRTVYRAVVIPILLYGAKMWAILGVSIYS